MYVYVHMHMILVHSVNPPFIFKHPFALAIILRICMLIIYFRVNVRTVYVWYKSPTT